MTNSPTKTSLLLGTLGSVSLIACSPAKLVPEPIVRNLHSPAPLVTTQKITIQTPQQPRIPTRIHKTKHQDISFSIVSFDSRDFQLVVADQPNGPGSVWTDAKTVAAKKGALAAINAGFFTPEGKPLGLVIENGIKRGSYNASSLGKGIYYTTDTSAKIERSHQWRTILNTKPQHLLQAGPMLVEKSSSTKGLSTKSSRVRSFIATDGKNHWIIGHASSCTLAQLGKALASLQIQDFKVITALNLDGGRSSDLWVSAEVANGSLSIRPFWNKSVRNFLILKKK